MKLRESVDEFIKYRRSIGEKYDTGAKQLNRLVKFIGVDIELCDLTSDLVTGFLYGGHDTVNATWFIRYGVVKGLVTWAKARGLYDGNPLPAKRPVHPERLRPYIYSNDELRRLFEGALHYRTRRHKKERHYPQCVRMIFILCYVLGLRLNETLNLHIKDLDLNKHIAYIRETKFYKSRIVTFNDTVTDTLKSFMYWRNTVGMSEEPETRLFMDVKGNPVNDKTIEGIFSRLRKRLGITRSDTRQQPRIHDLRHTFAVNRLTTWYRQGEDVQQLLPYLSTFMGHSHLRHTTVYLSMTDNLLEEANKRFESFANISDKNEN